MLHLYLFIFYRITLGIIFLFKNNYLKNDITKLLNNEEFFRHLYYIKFNKDIILN